MSDEFDEKEAAEPGSQTSIRRRGALAEFELYQKAHSPVLEQNQLKRNQLKSRHQRSIQQLPERQRELLKHFPQSELLEFQLLEQELLKQQQCERIQLERGLYRVPSLSMSEGPVPTFEQHPWLFEYLQTQEAFNQPGVDIERQSVGALLTDEDLYDHLRNLGAKWYLDRKGWFLFGRHMAFGGIEHVLCKEE